MTTPIPTDVEAIVKQLAMRMYSSTQGRYVNYQDVTELVLEVYTAGAVSRDAELREKVEGICDLHRFSAWSPQDPLLEEYSKGSKDTADAIRTDILALLTPPTTEKTPHYRLDKDGAKWVFWDNGEEMTEPYKHQDNQYAHMCVDPNYCHCSD